MACKLQRIRGSELIWKVLHEKLSHKSVIAILFVKLLTYGSRSLNLFNGLEHEDNQDGKDDCNYEIPILHSS